MAGGRPMAVLEVSDAERRELESLARRRKTAQALALRARIVLHCEEGLTNTEVATRLGVSKPTVGKWRQRFIRHRLDGLHDEPRPGTPRSITDDHVAKVVTLTLESKPKNATHWSTRSMAKRAGLSQTAISRIWRAFGLQPRREITFKISEDPQFVDKVRDVVGLYMSPPDRALVLCVDEKARFRHWIARSRSSRWAPGPPNGGHMTTTGTARRAFLQPWTLPPVP